MKKITVFILLVAAICTSSAFASPYYDAGSQIFSISVGTNVPLVGAYHKPNSDKLTVEVGPGGDHTGFTLGGYGSLDYEVFMNPYISIGGELGYQFNFIEDKNIFSEVPILFKATYVPLQGVIDLPISLGLGMNYLSYKGNSKLALMAELNIGVKYFFTDEWGLGLNSGITYTHEFYTSNPNMNGLFTFVPINLVVSYRH